MSKKITANQFCKEMLVATKKHFVNHNENKINFSNTSFLYYVPRILSFVVSNKGFDFPNFSESFISLWDYLSTHSTAQGKVPSKVLNKIKMNSEVVRNYPNAWSLDIDARLIDEKANLVNDYSIKNIKFGSPAPNKGFIFPYINNGNKRYYGIMLPYSPLKAMHSYQLEIIEHYTFNTNEKVHFTREIIVPINVGKTDNRHFAKVMDIQNDSGHNFDYFEFYNRKRRDWKLCFSELNNKVDDWQDYDNNDTIMGKQTILIGDSLVPNLSMEMGNICEPLILNDFYGTDEELGNSIVKYLNQFDKTKNNHWDTKVLAKSLVLVADSLSRSLIASMVKAKTKGRKEFNHNGLGCSNISIYNMVVNKRPRQLAILEEYPYSIRSQYDFEELMPPITVNAINHGN